ncbi:MAG TPA: pentapeptide repeat-containing protein [Candidatus Saccharimonadales bacterium]|nr:pentapeptide repeat-containing protein [Candidatus Saccharimonadales bacterium]
MKQSLPQPKDVSNLTPITAHQLTADATLDQVLLAEADFTGNEAKNLTFDDSLLERVSFTEAKIDKLSLSDTVVKTSDFSAARCSGGSFIRVRFVGGRLSGIDLSRSLLKDVVFEGCKLDMANFRFAKLERVQFIECNLTETDFQAAELVDVNFTSSHLERTEFGQCKVKNVDARQAELLDIRGWQDLKGLKIDSLQLVMIAPQLAANIGITVED